MLKKLHQWVDNPMARLLVGLILFNWQIRETDVLFLLAIELKVSPDLTL